METLRGIFPRTQPPPKRDFLRENVLKIKSMQSLKMRKSKDTTEYANKYSKQLRPRRLSMNESPSCHRSSNALQLCSSKAPINSLRKAVSSMSIQQNSIGVQTVDPDTDQFFLKDSIIRYPSASTVRSTSSSQQTMPTCSRGHFMDDGGSRATKYKRDSVRRNEREDRLEKQQSNLSDYYEKAPVLRKPTPILKTSSSLQKLNKDSLNETQQKVDRVKSGGGGGKSRVRTEEIVITDDDDDDDHAHNNGALEKSRAEEDESEKEHKRPKKVQMEENERSVGKRQQQLKAAADDPNCPEGHIPMDEEERLNSLKLAQKRAKELIDDLNRLPMTCETLRVRNKKIEIEKELKYLDSKVRLFSSRIVYVKLDE